MSRKLPDNKVQRLMKEALRGVAPREHDKDVDKFYVLEFQSGNEEAGWKLCEDYVDVFSVIMSKPTQPPKKTKAMQKLWVDPSLQDYEDLFQEILSHFLVLLKEYHPEKGSLVRVIRAKLHQRVFNQFFSEYLELKKVECEFDDTVKMAYENVAEEDAEPPKLPAHYIELYQALNKLTNKQRQVVELSVFKGWNSSEVAKEIGLSASTVRVTLRNSLSILRKELGGDKNGEEKLLELPTQRKRTRHFQGYESSLLVG